jgi:hypothetical protein
MPELGSQYGTTESTRTTGSSLRHLQLFVREWLGALQVEHRLLLHLATQGAVLQRASEGVVDENWRQSPKRTMIAENSCGARCRTERQPRSQLAPGTSAGPRWCPWPHSPRT